MLPFRSRCAASSGQSASCAFQFGTCAFPVANLHERIPFLIHRLCELFVNEILNNFTSHMHLALLVYVQTFQIPN